MKCSINIFKSFFVSVILVFSALAQASDNQMVLDSPKLGVGQVVEQVASTAPGTHQTGPLLGAARLSSVDVSVVEGLLLSVFFLLSILTVFWRMRRNALKEFSDSAIMLDVAMRVNKQTQFSLDVSNGIVTVGKNYPRSTHIQPNEYTISINSWLENIHEAERESVSKVLWSGINNRTPLDLEYRWKSTKDHWVWVHSLGNWEESQEGLKGEVISGISTDVSAQKREQHVLRMLAESNISKDTNEGIFELIVKELAVSQGAKYAVLATFGEDKERVTTRAAWIGEGYADNFSYQIEGTPCWEVIEQGSCFYAANVQEVFPHNKRFEKLGINSYSGFILRNRLGQEIGLIAVMDTDKMVNNVRRQRLMESLATRASIELEREETEGRLESLAHYDPLTGCANRSLLNDRFTQAKAVAKRTKTLIAVCFVDLDDFKPVNDQYGHTVGDRVLMEVASRLSASVRGADTVARLGGDEFVVLLGEVCHVEEIEFSLSRILSSLSKSYRVMGKDITISSSIGYTLSTGEIDEIDVLIRQADQAMYVAKSTGKNKVSLFDSELKELESIRQHRLEGIRQGLDKGEMCLFYQPKVNMQTGRVYGLEALIRWRHPDVGLLAPRDFLPVIEHSPLEITLGNWVINEAVEQIAIWNRVGLNLEVSINISPYHLLADDFLVALEFSLEQYRCVKPSQLQLEILESSVIEDLDKIIEVLTVCKNKFGIRVALDDFGTGYSSLAHLRHLPASVIKIDRTFVSNILGDKGDHEIVKGVIGLSEAFSLDVIAEGVETDEQGLALLELGCHCGQGSGIAKPMPAQDVAAWLAAYQANPRWMERESGQGHFDWLDMPV